MRLTEAEVPKTATSFSALTPLAQAALGLHFMANRVVLCYVDYPNDASSAGRVARMLHSELRTPWRTAGSLFELLEVPLTLSLSLSLCRAAPHLVAAFWAPCAWLYFRLF